MHTKLTNLNPNKLYILIGFSVIMLFTSCIPLRDVKYIQPDENLELNEFGKIQYNRPEYRLQINDYINIRISTRTEVDLGEFKDFTVSPSEVGGNQNNTAMGRGVRIQEDGNIELPRVGKIHLLDLTLNEARKKIETEFYKIYEESAAFIEVNSSGINFTIVGESNAGNYFVSQYEFNLLEAFAMSGDLSPVADRKHIQILRTTPQGTQRAEVDITKESVMNSEYFWLQPNDIIIINPRVQKQWGIGLNPIQTITTIFGGLAAIIGIFFFFRSL